MKPASIDDLLPRRQSSIHWTDLPSELAQNVKLIFTNQFRSESKNGSFVVEGRIYPEELVLRIGFLENGRLRQLNFEASVDLPSSDEFSPEFLDTNIESAELSLDAELEAEFGAENATPEQAVMGRLYLCLDAIGAVIEDYFDQLTSPQAEAEDLELPVKWESFDFDGDQVFLKTSTVNSNLEKEADRILGAATSGLLKEDTASEDALTLAEIDSELAFSVQKVIRSGKIPKTLLEEKDWDS